MASSPAEIQAHNVLHRNTENIDPNYEVPTKPSKEWLVDVETDEFVGAIADDVVQRIGLSEVGGHTPYTADEISDEVVTTIKGMLEIAHADGQRINLDNPMEEATISTLAFRARANSILHVLSSHTHADTASADADKQVVNNAFTDLYRFAPRYKQLPPEEKTNRIDAALAFYDSRNLYTTTSMEAAARAREVLIVEPIINANVQRWTDLQPQIAEVQARVARETVRADARATSRFDNLKFWRRGQLENGTNDRALLARLHAESDRLTVQTQIRTGEIVNDDDTARQEFATLQAESFMSDLNALQATTVESMNNPNAVHGRTMGTLMRLSRRYNRLGTGGKIAWGLAGGALGLAAGMINPLAAMGVSAMTRANMLNSARSYDRRNENQQIGEVWTKAQDTIDSINASPHGAAELGDLQTEAGARFNARMEREFNDMRTQRARRFGGKVLISAGMTAATGIASSLLESHGFYDWLGEKIEPAYEWFRDDLIPDGWGQMLPGGKEAFLNTIEHGQNTTPSDIESILQNHAGGSHIKPGSGEWNRVMEALHDNQINHADIKSIQGIIPPGTILTDEQKAEYFGSFFGSLDDHQSGDFGKWISAASEHEAGHSPNVFTAEPGPLHDQALADLRLSHGRGALFDAGVVQGHMPPAAVMEQIGNTSGGGNTIAQMINSPEKFGLTPEDMMQYTDAREGFESYIQNLLSGANGADKEAMLRDFAQNPDKYFSGTSANVVRHWLEAYSKSSGASLTLAA